MATEDAADSISWPDSMSDLGVLENLLKCGICYEFMNTVLITPCSHNFCSVCIRKFMQYRTSCPQCLTVVNEIELKNNRTLDEIIVVMRRLRGPLSQKLQGVQSAVKQDSPKPQKAASSPLKPISSKPPLQEANAQTSECEILMESPRRLPNSLFEASPLRTPLNNSGLLRSPAGSPSTTSQSRPEIKVRSLFNMMRSPPALTPTKTAVSNGIAKKVVAMVTCPICQVEIPEANINIHIDRCLERSNKEVVAAIKTPEKKPESRRRLPKLVYDYMKDAELRKKCAEAKLSNQGDKKTLVKRHKRYTLLYNSECDSSNPRPVSEIIKQVEREEREEAKANSKVFKALQIDRKAQPEVISSAQTQYRSEHKGHFNSLIAELRARQSSRENSSANPSSSKATSTVPGPSTSASCAISAPKTPEKPLELEVDDSDNADSPGTPNSEMDLLMSQQQSPVIRKMTNSAVRIILSDSDDEDSLQKMFSQPIPKSSSAKKVNKRRVRQKTDSGDEDDDDMWSDDLIKEKPNQRVSQTESMPLRRSSRKRSKNGKDSQL